jgi:hypothetical protein
MDSTDFLEGATLVLILQKRQCLQANLTDGGESPAPDDHNLPKAHTRPTDTAGLSRGGMLGPSDTLPRLQ